MASFLPPRSSKRPLDLASPDPVPKRACSPPPLAPHLSFLEELCEFDSSLDLESTTGEELVVEMMKSLEKIIGAIEESSPLVTSQLTVDASARDSSSTVPSRCGSDMEQFSGLSDGVDCAKAELQIKHLLEASDDELGIPTDSGNAIDQTPTNDADWAFVDGRCPDAVAPALGLHSTEGLYSHMLGGWIDGSFDQFDESMAVYTPRDHLDLISADHYL